MKNQTHPFPLPDPNQLEATPTSYQAAKAERTVYIIDWLGEHLMADKQPRCNGWPKTDLLLVINNSALTFQESEAEKLAVSAYTNEECLQRVKHFQETIKQRQSARWLPTTFNQIA